MEACVIACNSSPLHFPPLIVLQPLYFSLQAGLKKLEKPMQEKCNPGPNDTTWECTTKIWGCRCSALICCQWPCKENISSVWDYVKGIAEKDSASKMLLFVGWAERRPFCLFIPSKSSLHSVTVSSKKEKRWLMDPLTGWL